MSKIAIKLAFLPVAVAKMSYEKLEKKGVGRVCRMNMINSGLNRTLSTIPFPCFTRLNI